MCIANAVASVGANNVVSVAITPQLFQAYPIRFFAFNIPAMNLSTTANPNYVFNVDVSCLHIQKGILDVQLLPVSSTIQSGSSYMFVSGQYMDVTNNILQVYVWVSANGGVQYYTQPMVLYITYY